MASFRWTESLWLVDLVDKPSLVKESTGFDGLVVGLLDPAGKDPEIYFFWA